MLTATARRRAPPKRRPSPGSRGPDPPTLPIALGVTVVLAALALSALPVGAFGPAFPSPASGASGDAPSASARASGSVVGPLSVAIHNTMSAATGTYQQPVRIDSATFSAWINSNWSNGEVFPAASATPLHAWIESGASNTSTDTLLWVRMPSIPAGGWSNLTIAFGPPTSFDLSATGYIGEAPELSATYGAFDNGALVFNFYDDFAGSSLGSAWNVDGGWAYTVHDGFTWNSTPGNGDGIVTNRSFAYPAVVDAYGDLFESNPTGVYTGQGFGSGGCMICSPSNSSAVGWEAQTSLENGPAPWAARNSTLENGTSVFSTPTYAVFTTEAVNTSAADFLVDYAGAQQLTQGIPDSPVPIILAQTGLPAGNLTNPSSTTWIRERTYEPTLPTALVSGVPDTSVTFTASGLPWGTVWTVSLGVRSASGTGPLTFLEPNGTYPFSVGGINGYAASPSSGNVTAKGSNVTVAVSFVSVTGGRAYYAIDFTETGLPTGAAWGVTLNGTPHGSTSGTIGFTEPNGSYRYAVGCGANDTASPSSGTANVSGALVAISVVCQNATGGFTPLVFSAQGLSGDVSWSVTLTGDSTGLSIEASGTLTRTAVAGGSITFHVSAGTYAYLASAPGFSPRSGTVSSGGAPTLIAFSALPTSGSPTPKATAPVGATVVGLALIAIAGLVGGGAAYRARAQRVERGKGFVRGLGELEWTKDAAGEPVPTTNR